MIPKLYDGRNKTFFMGAYEGVRANALTAGFVTVPTALMRQGNFSEISTPIKNPLTGQPFPGNIIPQSQISPIARKLLEYYPAPKPAGDGVEPAGQRAHPTTTSTRSCSASIRTSATRLACTFATTGTTASPTTSRCRRRQFRFRWSTQPRDQQEFAVHLHAHAAAEPVQRFPDRLPPDRFRHAECLLRGRHAYRGRGSRHSRFQRRRPLQQPGDPDHQHQQLQRARGRRRELVSVRHDVPDVERDGLQPRLAQRAIRRRPAADGDRPAGGQ